MVGESEGTILGALKHSCYVVVLMLHAEHWPRGIEWHPRIGSLTPRLALQTALTLEHLHSSPSVPAKPGVSE